MLANIDHLPDHKLIYNALYQFFSSNPACSAMLIKGSGATGNLDQYSDLDFGIIYESHTALENVWEERWEWQVPPWFHRFDADHVRDHFIIYLFESGIKADLVLYTKDTLPSWQAAPVQLIYDKHNKFQSWVDNINSEYQRNQADFSLSIDELIHDDERFWACQYYSYQHIARGEYYNIAEDFGVLRAITEKWYAFVSYKSPFSVRRLESTFKPSELTQFKYFFPLPEKKSLIQACQRLIQLQLELRKQIEQDYQIVWTTKPKAIDKIQQVFKSLKTD